MGRGCRVGASLMGLATGVLLFVARMNESLVAHEEVAAGKCLCTYFADKRLLLGVSAYMSLQMFL